MLTKEDKTKVIYEKIADKTLSFWCKIIYEADLYFIIENDWISDIRLVDNEWCVLHLYENIISDYWKIIWHPVMYWDLLGYIRDTNKVLFGWNSDLCIFFNCFKNLDLWEEKRKPIEEQSEECIEYIYNLIK